MKRIKKFLLPTTIGFLFSNVFSYQKNSLIFYTRGDNWRESIDIYEKKALLSYFNEKFDDSLSYYDKAIDVVTQKPDQDLGELARMYLLKINALCASSKFTEAEDLLKQVKDILDRMEDSPLKLTLLSRYKIMLCRYYIVSNKDEEDVMKIMEEAWSCYENSKTTDYELMTELILGSISVCMKTESPLIDKFVNMFLNDVPKDKVDPLIVAHLYSVIGTLLIETGQVPIAEDVLKEALKYCPKDSKFHPDILKALGSIKIQTGDIKKAEKYLLSAIDHYKDFPDDLTPCLLTIIKTNLFLRNFSKI